jgi:Calcium binding
MARVKDEVREQRIVMEAVVDAYDSGERAMGWYYYLDGKMKVTIAEIKAIRATPAPWRPFTLPSTQPLNLESHHDWSISIRWRHLYISSSMSVRCAADSTSVAIMRPSRLLLFKKCKLGLCSLQFMKRFFPVSFEGTGNKPISRIDSHISTLRILRL